MRVRAHSQNKGCLIDPQQVVGFVVPNVFATLRPPVPTVAVAPAAFRNLRRLTGILGVFLTRIILHSHHDLAGYLATRVVMSGDTRANAPFNNSHTSSALTFLASSTRWRSSASSGGFLPSLLQ